LIELLKENGKENMLQDVYDKCRQSLLQPIDEVKNEVKTLYDSFTDEQIAAKISEILKPNHIFSNVEIIYQSIGNLHVACPNHTGDWYFSGNFPTPGGNRVVNKAFINYMEGRDARAY
jgi:amidophosphoribosyltransferase